MSRVVGIDQSYTNFGFSVDGESKKRSFPATRFDNDVDRLRAVRKWFTEWLNIQSTGHHIDLVVMEGYANAAKFGREMAGELGGVVKLAVLDSIGQPPLIVAPGSLKKFVTGSGAAKKNTMIMHVYKRWGVEFTDDNQADAYSLEKFGKAYLLPPLHPDYLALPKFQQEAIEAVRAGKKNR